MKDRPEAWFSAPQRNGVRIKNSRKYISVNPIKYFYDSYPVYYMVALYDNMDTSQEYTLTITIPGNDLVTLFYTFTDSSLIYQDDKSLASQLIDKIEFDSIKIKGKKKEFILQPKQPGNFLLFKLQNTDRKMETSYGQYLEFISLTPLVYMDIDLEKFKKRKKEVYSEDRAHSFSIPCPAKTLIEK